MIGVLVIILCALLTVSGQALWKVTFNHVAFNLNWAFLSYVLTSKTFYLGTIAYIVATCIWFYALSKYDLSYVSPLMSLTYIFALVIGYFAFGEVISLNKIIGVFLILSGAALITIR